MDGLAVTASVFSSFWYRVHELEPAIAAHVRIERQSCRGETWQLLLDPHGGRSLRLNRAAYAIAGRLTGRHSLQQVWEAASTELGDDAPTQDECIRILAQLHERGLLDCQRAADFDALHRHWTDQTSKRSRQARSLLAFRIALGNPTRLLEALQGWGRQVYRAPVLLLWFAFVAAATLVAAVNWSALHAHGAKWLGTPRYILIALLVYPLIKAVHELAHGLALRRWGGQVREWGITLLLLMPVPFIDGSGTAALSRAHQRALVSAAGIMAELWIAAIALMVWLTLQPGLVQDIAFVTAFIGAVSTLLFNANPLLKFDGYYVLCDLFQLPNLAPRSARYWSESLQRRILGTKPAEPLLTARGERPWLAAYAPLSLLYRIVLAIAIVTWAGSHSTVLGAIVLLAVAAQFLMPLARSIARVTCASALGSAARARVLATGAGLALALTAAIMAVPLPYAALAQGVAWIPEQALVRAETEGFVDATPVADGAEVRAGDVLLVLRNPALAAEAIQLDARLNALETELFHALRGEAAKAQEAAEALEQARAELARTRERIDALSVRAAVAGTLVMNRQQDLANTYVREGDLLGHVLSADAGIIRVAVPQDEAVSVRSRTRAIAAHVAGASSPTVAGELVHDSLGANRELPSAALSTLNGGSIVTEPDAKETLTPLDPVVLVDVRVPAGLLDGRTGQRAWVRFDYGAASLAQQWGRRARQGLLKHFNPAG